METKQLKIQVNEVATVTLSVPGKFTAFTFSEFYNKITELAKKMKGVQLRGYSPTGTPEIFLMNNWQSKSECIEVLDAWKRGGRNETVDYVENLKGVKLEQEEVSKISGLVSTLRAKYEVKND